MSTAFDEDRIFLFGLVSFSGFGPRRIALLKKQFGNCRIAFEASLPELEAIGIPHKIGEKFMTWRKSFDLTQEVKRFPNDLQLIALEDDLYPPLLRELYDAPPLLFVRGDMAVLHKPCIAVVGTRHPTPYGQMMTEQIATDLARAGVTVVSGLATGIDATAHTAAMKTGKTAAVLGSGVDDQSIFPLANRPLGKRLLEEGHVLMSEYPPGAPALAFHFPMRNRIIAGLCIATVVVEATEKSGSLITARSALDNNRDVFALPGHASSPTSRGPHRLIQQGAGLVICAEDILQTLALGTQGASLPTPISEIDLSQLTLNEQALWHTLSRSMHIDELAVLVDREAQEVAQDLTQMELQGYVIDTGGMIFHRRHI